MKNSRMYMADALNEVIHHSDTTPTQKNSLKELVKLTGESLLLDCLVNTVCRISFEEPKTLSSVVTTFCDTYSSEALYYKLRSQLKKQHLAKFEKLIQSQNDYTAKLRGRTLRASTRANLIPLLMENDSNTYGATHPFRKLFNKTNKKDMIDTVQRRINAIRPLVMVVIIAFGEATEAYVIKQEGFAKGKEVPFTIQATHPKTSAVNYMHKEPQALIDQKISVPCNKITSVTQAIEATVNAPFTFDVEYNKAVMAIVDTDLFRDLLAGRSTDTVSIRAKVEQARESVHEGIDFWNELGQGTVYFDYVVDFRGRISQLGGLSAVGHKVGKAMLRSGEAHELGVNGYDNMLIALAGSMGLDKETFSVRLAYGKENVAKHVAIGKLLLIDPVAAFNQLKGADDAFDAATLSLELYRLSIYNGNPSEFKSNIFIGYDATSSAVQLVGLIMGNETLTEASNVRVGANTEDKIHDSYMLVADIMDLACEKLVTDENAEFLNIWKEMDKKTKRAFAKPLLMTRLYGSKFLTHMDSCREVAVEKGVISANDSKLNGFGKTIAKLFNFAFDNEKGFNCLRSYEKFTKNVAKAYADKALDVTWSVQDASLFNNQVVSAHYEKLEGQQYKAYVDGQVRVLRTYNLNVLEDCKKALNYEENTKVDKRRAVSAIAPNYIHSHDALVLHSVVNKLNRPMRLTHDCFATTPGMVDKMSKAINETYVELFGDNRLNQIQKLQEECFENTGVLVDMPDNYNEAGIPSSEIEAATYKFS